MSIPPVLPYLPQDLFSASNGLLNVPQVLIAPARYIQGSAVLSQLARYLALVPCKHPALLLSAGYLQRNGKPLLQQLHNAGLDAVTLPFNGECSTEEVARIVALLQSDYPSVDAIVALGGGKCLDAGKCVAYRLGLPMVSCPSIASSDAPCSALSVMYQPDGAFSGVEFFPHSPALVVVDTQLVANAPVRYLVAGMGDAMATWYEARTCYQNPVALSTLGARPTLAAKALGECCAKTLFADGLAAVQAVQDNSVTEALERVVEANTLLSGIGFESGGLAVAHAIAQGLTVIPAIHQQYLHGEMVAMGLLTQLVLEQQLAEAQQVAEFFAHLGLPIHLGQLSLLKQDINARQAIVDSAMSLAFIHNEPFSVTSALLLIALEQASDLGLAVAAQLGDAAYRRLQDL